MIGFETDSNLPLSPSPHIRTELLLCYAGFGEKPERERTLLGHIPVIEQHLQNCQQCKETVTRLEVIAEKAKKKKTTVTARVTS